MSRRPALPVFAALLAVATTASAQPVGPRQQVNQFAVGDQGGHMSCGYYERRAQDVASDADGNFVVVWSSGDEDGYDSDIFARRYDRYGIPQGDEFQVSARATGSHRTPAVAMDPAGSFVVVWNAYAPDGGTYYGDVYARRYGVNGAPQAPPFRVSDNAFTISYGTYSYQYFHYSQIRNPDVDKDAAGNFIVVWQHESSYPEFLGDDDGRQVVARRYSGTGAPQGTRFKVSDGANQDYYWNEMPDVAYDTTGKFVVVWKSIPPDGGEAVLGRRYDAAATPFGGEFRISTGTGYTYFESTPDVETDASGGFMVVWGSTSLDVMHDATDVAARRFDASGTPLGGEFRVNTTTDYYQCGPSLARLDNGNFVVTWHEPFGTNGAGQVLDGSGAAVGGEFALDPGGYVQGTVVAPQQNDFVVAWSDAEDPGTDDADVYLQRFGTTHAPACSPTPLTTCRLQTKDRAGTLRYGVRPNPSSTRLTWIWAKGEATTHGEYGNPFDDTNYVFCLYDGSAAPQPLAALITPGGGFCGGVPCWRQLGGPSGPIQYVAANDPNASGVAQIRLKPGADGATKITFTARGDHLSLPTGTLTAPVVFQAQASSGECWSAEYDTFIRKNEPGSFVGKPNL